MKYSDLINPTVKIPPGNYENIFNIYSDTDGFLFFNILKAVDFPQDLASVIYTLYETKPKDAYPLIAWNHYQNVSLWWIVCAVNNIENPIKQPEVGTVLKILKPFFVSQVIQKMSQKDI